MWSWRALVFSLFIAIFIATSAPARSVDINLDASYASLTSQSDTHLNNEYHQITPLDVTQAWSPEYILIEQKTTLKKRKSSHKENDKGSFQSNPASDFFKVNRDIRWPPFERSAYSAFNSTIQNEPIFVLAYEFLPEILGRQHFLAPLNPSVDIPWFLRPDAADNQSKLSGWKDGNTQYSGAITYLS
ncbi:hypothetical protein Q4574_16735 [Aliiglaciecola sp. 3_MG-2023]|uniref:hypothetical protein n=1 Tax=Aliiglaciecola sp. 3_MG-2023 TaxID=3062644 RepID=UPI0026E40AC8|nr:hypothetical protein [Aliiglaciecola sp. 3_MG-2023]MDO6694946.1 hypothetical protein [Aliiglaciecola sp. 3_MG-2023]